MSSPLRLPSISSLSSYWDTRGDVEWEIAIVLAEMSALAYTTPHNRELVLTLMGFDALELLDDGPRSGFLAKYGDAAVVAFCGTDDLEDWFANFDFRDQPQLAEGRTVHRGFKDYYDAFGSRVRQVLANWQPQQTWITGHSLGGAMAAYCVVDFIDNNVPFAGVVTFGQPRIGNKLLATQLNMVAAGRYMRFVNEDDAVPLAPPGVLWDYWHCGSRRRFRDGELEEHEGLAYFSCTAPPEEGAVEFAPPVEVDDGEESLTEAEFQEFRERLRRRDAVGADEGGPTEVEGPDPDGNAAPLACSAPPGSYTSGFIDFFKKRLNDHSMVEYLRQLNEFRDRAATSQN